MCHYESGADEHGALCIFLGVTVHWAETLAICLILMLMRQAAYYASGIIPSKSAMPSMCGHSPSGSLFFLALSVLNARNYLC